MFREVRENLKEFSKKKKIGDPKDPEVWNMYIYIDYRLFKYSSTDVCESFGQAH